MNLTELSSLGSPAGGVFGDDNPALLRPLIKP